MKVERSVVTTINEGVTLCYYHHSMKSRSAVKSGIISAAINTFSEIPQVVVGP